MIDFILHVVIFVAWLICTFPPLAASKNRVAQITRAITKGVLSFCIGYGLGHAFMEVFFK